MDNTLQTWSNLMETAQQILFRGQVQNVYKPSIQFGLEPSFQNHFFLQLVIEETMVKWYRTTWLKHDDVPKFLDPIENLKYIGKNIKPTFIKENGVIELTKLESIITFINLLQIKPQLKKSNRIVLDGTHYTLIIGVERMKTTLKWHYLPDEWSELEKLVNMLLDLNVLLR
jgi:hypothetical protein